MGWPYQLLDLNPDERYERRLTIDRYGAIAQLSVLVPIIAYQIYRLGAWVSSGKETSKVEYSAVGSAGLRRPGQATSGTVARTWRVWKWWMEDELAPGWGLRGHWIAGGVWLSWLLFLCIHGTGKDYLHITKRFGHVAAAQFPLHFMLTMRTQYSPLALAFGSSHEELNPWHRVSGRVIFFLLLNHAVWYLNYFVQAGVAYKRLTSLVVIVGIIGFLAITILSTTSLAVVRRWSYRVFFILHLVLGIAVLPILFVHTKELRFYIAEAFFLFIVDVSLKRLDTTTGLTTITKISNSKLIKLKIPIPPTKYARFSAAPGQHVYLSIPRESIPKHVPHTLLYELLFNPFTVAEATPTDVTLVLRTMNGPTTAAINTLAGLSKAKPPINIQGPFGAARGFPTFLDKYDRVLLVAGGVGATFILPIYRELRTELESESTGSDRLKFIWSMRSASEAAWAITSPAEPSLENDENVKIHLTRSSADDRPNNLTVGTSVELNDLRHAAKSIKPTGGRERPDLKKIVDEVFSMGTEERIAVLVCGPQGLASELRKHVGSWVTKGRDVWYHDESFGW